MEAVGGDGTGVCRGQDHLEHGQHPGTDQGHDDESGSAQAEEDTARRVALRTMNR